jgi:hypothetical protein
VRAAGFVCADWDCDGSPERCSGAYAGCRPILEGAVPFDCARCAASLETLPLARVWCGGGGGEMVPRGVDLGVHRRRVARRRAQLRLVTKRRSEPLCRKGAEGRNGEIGAAEPRRVSGGPPGLLSGEALRWGER